MAQTSGRAGNVFAGAPERAVWAVGSCGRLTSRLKYGVGFLGKTKESTEGVMGVGNETIRFP